MGTSEEIEILVRGFDIVDEARFTVVGKPSFEASRLDFALTENARCVWGIWDGLKGGTDIGGGDGLIPSGFWGAGLDCADIPFPDFEGDNDKGVDGEDTIGSIEGNTL